MQSSPPTQKLLKRVVDAAEPRVGKAYCIWDSELKGFRLRIRSSGRKTFELRYRVGRRQRLFVIGDYGALTPDQARKAASDAKHLVSRGGDPQHEKETVRRAATVNELVDLYLTEGRIDKPTKRESSWATDAVDLRCHVQPLLGSRSLLDLSTHEIARWQNDIIKGKTARVVKTGFRRKSIVKGGRSVVGRATRTLTAMLNWAVKREFIKDNPAARAPKFPDRKRERFLTNEEAVSLFSALLDMELRGEISEQHADLFRLLALTGARLAEMRDLAWAEIDFGRQMVVLEPERHKAGRTGRKVINLNAPALEILQRRRNTSDWAKQALLGLMLHPLDAVFEEAVRGALQCWDDDPEFSWTALSLGLALSHEEHSREDWRDRPAAQARTDAALQEKLRIALDGLQQRPFDWQTLTLPPQSEKDVDDDYEDDTKEDDLDEEEAPPSAVSTRPIFRTDLAIRVFRHLPTSKATAHKEARASLLDCAAHHLDWTISQHPPEREKRGSRPFEWTFAFMPWLAALCEAVAESGEGGRFIDPIIAIEDEDACFELLSTFADCFVCRQIHDAPVLTPMTLGIYKSICDRVAQAQWRWHANHVDGALTREKHTLLKSLLLISVRAKNAARFANDDWSDIASVLPAMASLLEQTAPATGALGYYLELCERAIDHYPGDAMAAALSRYVIAQKDKPTAIRSIAAPEQIAACVQALAARDHPLPEPLRAELLSVLDLLVELGDRRSAALLNSESFRTVRRLAA